jgi:hypothetical protein
MHKFLYVILSKNHTGKDRRNITTGKVWTQKDFAERLTLKFNKEAQIEHFGGGSSISRREWQLNFFQWVSQ